jgi:hypothetical protein
MYASGLIGAVVVVVEDREAEVVVVVAEGEVVVVVDEVGVVADEWGVAVLAGGGWGTVCPRAEARTRTLLPPTIR